MNKNVFGKKFKRDKNERTALFKGLMSSLILDEKIKTTEQKAKAIKGSVEKAVTKAIKYGEASKRLLGGEIFPDALDKLVKDIAPRFKNRHGGYTRILKMGKRFGDDAMVVLMEWTEGPAAIELKVKSEKVKSKKDLPAQTGVKPVKKKASKTQVSKAPKPVKKMLAKKTKKK